MTAAQYAVWFSVYNQAIQQGKPPQNALELADKTANYQGA
jgi:hypothetical protein